ncbi:MAG: tetratricopeptide repeat protein [Gammaproteobacteria bacterium]|nr:tetratricopeptide repeat protein [Gammaproteobacteria bacterium]MCI0590104.1 tetratricopeptide repeat protein [Gammaproteobacteria bacterium]
MKYLLTLCAVTILMVASSLALFAEDSTRMRIRALIAQGQLSEALELANEAIEQDPGDLEIRFLEGLILTDLNRLDRAEEAYLAIINAHPDMPEPYNNLAAIYAAQGQYEKAREALQMAINAHPNYAKAHENLGDVYVKMAMEAYQDALRLDDTSQAVRKKLVIIDRLFSVHVEYNAAEQSRIESKDREASLGQPPEAIDETGAGIGDPAGPEE